MQGGTPSRQVLRSHEVAAIERRVKCCSHCGCRPAVLALGAERHGSGDGSHERSSIRDAGAQRRQAVDGVARMREQSRDIRNPPED